MPTIKLTAKKTSARRRYSRRVGKSAWREKFIAAWSRTDALFGLIQNDDLFTQPIVWRHPFIFYVGHLPAFSWNQICGGILNWQSRNACFDEIFCRGIDPDVDTRTCHWHPEPPPEWPSLREIVSYRNQVRRAILDAIHGGPRHGGSGVMLRGGRVFQMVLEHEYMHQETLLYMMQEAPAARKIGPASGGRYSFRKAPPACRIQIPAGR